MNYLRQHIIKTYKLRGHTAIAIADKYKFEYIIPFSYTDLLQHNPGSRLIFARYKLIDNRPLTYHSRKLPLERGFIYCGIIQDKFQTGELSGCYEWQFGKKHDVNKLPLQLTYIFEEQNRLKHQLLATNAEEANDLAGILTI